MKIVRLLTGIYYIFDFAMMDVVFEENGIESEGTIVDELIDKVLESKLPYTVKESNMENVQLRLF